MQNRSCRGVGGFGVTGPAFGSLVRRFLPVMSKKGAGECPERMVSDPKPGAQRRIGADFGTGRHLIMPQCPICAGPGVPEVTRGPVSY